MTKYKSIFNDGKCSKTMFPDDESAIAKIQLQQANF